MRTTRLPYFLVAVAVAAVLLAVPSSSSATVLCQAKAYACPTVGTYAEETAFSGTLEAGGEASFETNLGTIKCKESILEGETLEEEGEPLAGKVTALEFTLCDVGETSCTLTTEKTPYGAQVAYTNEGNGTLTIGSKEKPVKLTVKCGLLLNCTYSSTPALTATGGDPMAVAGAAIALKAESGTMCPEKTTLTVTYALQNPSEGIVFVAQQRGITQKLCSEIPPEDATTHKLKCKTGQGYSGELKGELASGVTEFQSPTEPTKKVTCNETTYVGKFKEDGGATNPGGITGLAFSSKVGGIPGKPCSSSFAGSPEVKIVVEGLPYDQASVVYQLLSNPQGMLFFWPQNGVPLKIKFEVNTTPAQVCKYEQRGIVTGEWLNGAGMNPSLLNPLVGSLRYTSGGAICPVDMKLTASMTVRGQGNSLVYIAGE